MRDIGFWYAEGKALLVCGPRVAVIAPLAPTEALVLELLDLLAHPGMSTDDVLDLLIRPGLRALKSFAICERAESGVRLVLRGQYHAVVPGSPQLKPRQPWSDDVLPAVTCLRINTGEDDNSPVALRLIHGTVRVSSLSLSCLPGSGAGHTPAKRVADPLGPGAGGATPDVYSSQDPVDLLAALPGSVARNTIPTVSTGDLPDSSASPDELPKPTPEPASPPPIEFPSLIESFPWTQEAIPSPAAASAQPAPVPEPAPRRPEAPVARPAPPLPVQPGDTTVCREELRGPGAGAQPQVIATRCRAGHLNAPYATRCRVCGAGIDPQQPQLVPRPPLGVLRLGVNDVVLLDRPVIIGRNPRISHTYAGEQPHLVQVPDPGRDISSQHLEVSLDGWHVAVKDLGSTNGTRVILPGVAPVMLRPHDPLTIEPGTRVVLAGVFEFVFEAQP
ncbi:MAG: FHA domain-containing protein [Propionibacteriaceae bacterium]|nr:FHA domain-containing protein [Propionibacteriaceae bacterium]